MIDLPQRIRPVLDPDFLPASLWVGRYQAAAVEAGGGRRIRIALERPSGERWCFDTRMLPDAPEYAAVNRRYGERLVKTLLWAWGGHRVRIAGAPELVAALRRSYRAGGERAFDAAFFGEDCFQTPLLMEEAEEAELHAVAAPPRSEGIDLSGCRIGFDLGGSDRKCAALIDGEVVFSEEIPWSPYFEKNFRYHIDGIQDSLERAARHLPRVDAIGGSAAGVYIDNEPRVGSLFRGLSRTDFRAHIQPMFKELAKRWGDVPFAVANDGDVTAIAGAMALGQNAVLGISMGTSQAAGYLDPAGDVQGWLNELAFVPVDFREDAPRDEWSGDRGCGVQYFSQQAVGRLLPAAGIEVDERCSLPEKLEVTQERMVRGDERAAAIYDTLGVYFGYALAYYADFYAFSNSLVLGRVTSGQGGDRILAEAKRVLDAAFPDLASKLWFHTPDEKMKRHGQAVAAASLPRLK